MTSPVPGTFCLVLHSHLPWLPGHGVWPLGEEWLSQAWVESYVPLVAELDSLAAEGHRDVLTLGVTPVLAAQLDHPRMRRDVGTWVGLAQQRARELGFDPDPSRRAAASREYAVAARAEELLATRWSGGGSPVLRSLRDTGVVELLGGPPAHPFLPLLLPEVAALALEAGLSDSTWRLGQRPRGIWSPECGWTPGLASVFDAAGIGHFVVDEQLVRDAGGHPHAAWRVEGSGVVAVPRDLEVTNLVWSSRTGYPAAAAYRDFHSRDPGTGIRLWAVGHGGDGAKATYDPQAASAQLDRDVSHFVTAVRGRLEQALTATGAPGLVVAAYDTELFGHWWHEGPQFVGRAIRALRDNGIHVDTLQNALAAGHVAGELALGAGSWGAGKDFSVWDGPAVSHLAHENTWLQRRWLDLVARERSAGRLGNRRPDLDQLLLTLWNALSSDWAFLVSRGQSVDYALRRADEHRVDFHRLAQLVEDHDDRAPVEAARQARHDRTFPAVDARVTPGR
ncbi:MULTISPECIES: 1,4-alpha-glucan branching protein domain-containing protein [unclassified Phycicoccus]|uniref:1,4-alpha-glucan branching protein domain-containing protein n=1 Tax=unclassified Phycicoccus TaxID=2637926 RepID=UPI000B1B1CDD|nr:MULTISPECIES: 1,4-alpha-glucan branching protein domain-containing protein [unclassified Phycicoccus]